MKDYVINFICNHTTNENLKMLDSCICSYELVEDWQPTKDEAVEFIKKYFSDIAEFKETYKVDTFYDPFIAPQEFMIEVVREYIIIILDQKFSVKNLKNILTNQY